MPNHGSIYGQFCPVSRATEILGERWTLLIIRELLLGSCRFSELQKGLSRISPTLLNKRLSDLEAAQIIYKKKANGQKGFEYHLTESGLALHSIITGLASWGVNWIEEQFSPEELDLELLMFDIERSLDLSRFPASETTLKFHFTDAEQIKDWWLKVTPHSTELCTQDTGAEPHVYITTCVRSMTNVWMGLESWPQFLKSDRIKVMGATSLIKQLPHWIGVSRTVAFKQAS